jgi:hypothetical protein
VVAADDPHLRPAVTDRPARKRQVSKRHSPRTFRNS